ncbi:MAG: hypothetical protein AMXMBFR48_14720 [Ignavibacteriales bacterium]
MKQNNPKSDVNAKSAYAEHLRNSGRFNEGSVQIIKSPADIEAKIGEDTYYFEIKMTRRKETAFGAATITEWEAALRNPDKFRFVIAHETEEGKFIFTEYTPDKFLMYSTIPPFKVYFNVPLLADSDNQTIEEKRQSSKSVIATSQKLEDIIAFYCHLKSSSLQQNEGN